MSVRSRINELIDSKNLSDAIKTIELRHTDITTADVLSVHHLIQKLIDAKEPLQILHVLSYLRKSPVFLSSGDFSSVIKSLIRLNSIEATKQFLLESMETKHISECQVLLAFIEGSIDCGSLDNAFEIINHMNKIKIPLNERSWESILSWFSKKDAIVHAAGCLKIMSLPELKSKRIWEDFIASCVRSKNQLLAIETVHEISIKSDKSLSFLIWNLLLKKVVDDSDVPSFEICKILDKAIELGIIIESDILSQSLIRLVIAEEQDKVVPYLKNMKNSVSPFVVSRLISKLIDMNLPREALEISNLVVLENFGPQVTVDMLEITNEKLKWILKHQQMQMIKFMKRKKEIEETNKVEQVPDIDDEEFVFL
ncbi:hypothetical protein SteCoe_766 [Stentor coeruleus]|uniref:Pentacotripeptide-repeat region of PRORP domain-containing protein n=1 Tax=Stentor coeruleus TaxID=5963 RepID=A0A1R2D361_9CILI|nr:hypothetical protein SteCoe_766 [Stentor coeruleus]